MRWMPKSLLKAFIRTGIVLFILCAVVLVFTRNKFPGGWIKNRLRLTSVENKLKHAQEQNNAFLKEHGLTHPLENVSIRIIKAERKLFLYSRDKLIKTYRIGLGGNPEGHKGQEGDQKTPVGQYYVCTRNDRSRFYLFLGISYPNNEDALKGLAEGLITKNQYEQIAQAIYDKQKPPWNTPLGGAIGIHGSGSNYDWTLGCIALDDDDICELWHATKMGTPVTIYETVPE